MDALDLSNNTTRFNPQTVQRWRDQGIGLGIIQLISGVRLAGDDCATQIRNCLDGGLAVDCYLFPGNDGLPLTTLDRLALVPLSLRPKIRQYWVDVEPAHTDPTHAQVSACHMACDVWAPHQRTGDYSALWVANKMGWLPWPWPDRKQWLVNVFNDGHPNLGGKFSGTNNHVMTQYREDVTLAGVSGIDRSLLSDSEAQEVTKWLGGPKVAIVVGQGMQAQMDLANDFALCDHINYDQTDSEGNTFQVERCQGSKGTYVSSNSSGQWVNAGPL